MSNDPSMDRILAALEESNAQRRADNAAAAELLGPLHAPPENAANSSAPTFDLNKMALAPGGTNTIATHVESHQPREKIYDDSEAKAVQGRMWLLSFTDLFSLMLCFFLMLYSMKDPAASNAPVLAGSNAHNLHLGDGTGQAGAEAGANIARVGMGEGLNLDYLQGILKNALSQVHLENDVRITPGKDHLNLGVDMEAVFSGNVLSPEGQRVAKGLANRLATLTNRITVIAVPADTNGWADSLAQATAFSELMRDAGYRKNFAVVGEGGGNNPGLRIRVDADDGNVR